MRRLVMPGGLALALAALLASSASVQAQDKMIEKITQALPEKAPAQPKQPRKILLFSKTAGFRHSSIPIGIRAITLMGDKTGAYTVLASEDESMFEPEKLKAFDAVFMLNTTLDCLRPKNAKKDEVNPREEMLKKSFEDFVKGGKGLIGVHAATDTYHDWKDYNEMMGGCFISHPWTKIVPIKNMAPKNPVNAAFHGQGFEINDEIYQFRPDTALATERKMLLALDTDKMTKKDLAKGQRKDNLYAVSWISKFGKGRTFYCSLGHREEIYWNPAILQHYLAGIQYALGDLKANATPTASSSTSAQEYSPRSAK